MSAERHAWLKAVLPSARPVGLLKGTEPKQEKPGGLKRKKRMKRVNAKRKKERHAACFGPCANMACLLECVVPTCRVGWPKKLEAAHVRSRGAGGVDRANVVGLCWRHHRAQHDMGWPAFEKKHGFSAEVAAGFIAEAVDAHECCSWAMAGEIGRVVCAVCLEPTEEPRV